TVPRGRRRGARSARPMAAGRAGFPGVHPFPRHRAGSDDRRHAAWPRRPSMNTLSVALGLACLGGAAVVGGASPAGARTELEAMVRPIALPFLWRSLGDASRAGDPAEAFAKAQLLLEAIPGWADGYIVFAYRYALDGGDVALPPAARERAAADRLQIGLSVLDRARASCQRDEIDLLVSMSWLVELAVRREPGIAPLLGTAPAVLADGFLVAAEARGAGRMVREQR